MTSLNLDTPIYKYIPLQYLLSMIVQRKIIVGRISRWDDVYENFFFKENYKILGDPPNYHISAKVLIKGLYGQSWTLKEESDAMWRIYSKYNHRDLTKDFCLNTSVKIKTNIGALFKMFHLEKSYDSAYIDRVSYKNEKEMQEWICSRKEINSKEQFKDSLIDSLFIKRDFFRMNVRSVLCFSIH